MEKDTSFSSASFPIMYMSCTYDTSLSLLLCKQEDLALMKLDERSKQYKLVSGAVMFPMVRTVE